MNIVKIKALYCRFDSESSMVLFAYRNFCNVGNKLFNGISRKRRYTEFVGKFSMENKNVRNFF